MLSSRGHLTLYVQSQSSGAPASSLSTHPAATLFDFDRLPSDNIRHHITVVCSHRYSHRSSASIELSRSQPLFAQFHLVPTVISPIITPTTPSVPGGLYALHISSAPPLQPAHSDQKRKPSPTPVVAGYRHLLLGLLRVSIRLYRFIRRSCIEAGLRQRPISIACPTTSDPSARIYAQLILLSLSLPMDITLFLRSSSSTTSVASLLLRTTSHSTPLL